METNVISLLHLLMDQTKIKYHEFEWYFSCLVLQVTSVCAYTHKTHIHTRKGEPKPNTTTKNYESIRNENKFIGSFVQFIRMRWTRAVCNTNNKQETTRKKIQQPCREPKNDIVNKTGPNKSHSSEIHWYYFNGIEYYMYIRLSTAVWRMQLATFIYSLWILHHLRRHTMDLLPIKAKAFSRVEENRHIFLHSNNCWRTHQTKQKPIQWNTYDR